MLCWLGEERSVLCWMWGRGVFCVVIAATRIESNWCCSHVHESSSSGHTSRENDSSSSPSCRQLPTGLGLGHGAPPIPMLELGSDLIFLR